MSIKREDFRDIKGVNQNLKGFSLPGKKGLKALLKRWKRVKKRPGPKIA